MSQKLVTSIEIRCLLNQIPVYPGYLIFGVLDLSHCCTQFFLTFSQVQESTFEQEPGSGAKAIVEGMLVTVGTLEWLQRCATSCISIDDFS